MSSMTRGRQATSRRRRWPRRGSARARSRAYYLLAPAAWLLAIIDVLLLVWMAISSFKTARELMLRPWALPTRWVWQNYVDAWHTARLAEGFLNSVILVLGSGVGCLIIAAPAAYALSRFRSKGVGSITVFFIVGLGIPAQGIYIPLYIGLAHLGLTNSIWGLMLIYIGFGVPYALFLLTAFFRSLPRELEEAAAIDGLTPWRTFWSIMLPLARSGLITVFVLQAIGHWGETFFALVMLQDKTTLSLSVYQFMQSMQYSGSQWSVLFAGLMIIIVPLLALYMWLGSRVIEGIGAGYGR